MRFTATSYFSGKPFEVSVEEVAGVLRDEQGITEIQTNHGAYYPVCESVFEIMRRIVAATGDWEPTPDLNVDTI
jgi:hypothetical protein